MQTSISDDFDTNNTKKEIKWVYVAGKVSGEDPTEYSLKFAKASAILTKKGYLVVNPLHVVSNPFCKWDKAMRHCITALLGCDAIYLLPCWKQSKGARLERSIAKEVGIKIIEAENLL